MSKKKKYIFEMTAEDFVKNMHEKLNKLDERMVAVIGDRKNDEQVNICINSKAVGGYVNLANRGISRIFLCGVGQGSTKSGVEQIYTFVAAMMAVDPQLSKDRAAEMLMQMISGSYNTKGEVSCEENEIKYIVGAMTGYTCITILKK